MTHNMSKRWNNHMTEHYEEPLQLLSLRCKMGSENKDFTYYNLLC
jgi:hypothetical protein